MRAAFFRAAPGVKIIGHAVGSVGGLVDDDVYAAGLAVTTANAVMAESVAEWSLLMTLVAQRNLPAYASSVPLPGRSQG